MVVGTPLGRTGANEPVCANDGEATSVRMAGATYAALARTSRRVCPFEACLSMMFSLRYRVPRTFGIGQQVQLGELPHRGRDIALRDVDAHVVGAGQRLGDVAHGPRAVAVLPHERRRSVELVDHAPSTIEDDELAVDLPDENLRPPGIGSGSGAPGDLHIRLFLHKNRHPPRSSQHGRRCVHALLPVRAIPPPLDAHTVGRGMA